MAFPVLFALPVLCVEWVARSNFSMPRAPNFCLSCHIMEPYGKSLLVDDPGHLAAAHFQKHHVPPEEATSTTRCLEE